MSIFSTVPAARVPYSKFDLSHNRKLSCCIGELVPVGCYEVIPGDEWKINSDVFARMAPLVFPIMHKVEIFIHAFYVPMRVLYELASDDTSPAKRWDKFISGDNAMPDTVLVPNATIGSDIYEGSLSDHLGLPVGTYADAAARNEKINVMPHMAYMSIWNNYYRDENLETEYDMSLPANIASLPQAPLKKRAWEKDYFTSAWPWAQKGVASGAVIDIDETVAAKLLNVDLSAASAENIARTAVTGDLKGATSGKAVYLDAELTLSIEELRRANKMKIWMERNARAGTRYTEFLKGHFGVWPKDERLQRPEYIGGGVTPFVVSDVTNQSGFTDADPAALPLGSLAGKASSYGTSNMIYKKADEHGYIMIILSVRPEAVYYQGLPRMFSKLTYLDFPFPEFADLGEQEIRNKEIYFKDGAGNSDTFGYQSRYAEYKYIPNSLHGAFRTSLDGWTMARKFANAPQLNAQFIQIDEVADDLDRVFAVEENVEHIYIQVMHRVECARPLPFFNIPSLE